MSRPRPYIPPKVQRGIKIFWSNVLPEPNSGCWLWIGNVDRDGYGRTTIANNKGRAHRVSYEMRHGPVPRGLILRHRCDVRCCVNPDHLAPGTPADNAQDRMAHGKRLVRQGAANPSSVLIESEVRQIFNDDRPYSAIAKQYGVSTITISNIKCGKSWRHLDLGSARRGTGGSSSRPSSKARRGPSLRVLVDAALIQLGLDPADVEWHHEPPLAMRPWDGHDYIPPANDPYHLVPMASAAHRKRTAEADIPAIAKTNRITKNEEEARSRMLAKECGKPPPRKNTIRSRGFNRRPKPVRPQAHEERQ